MSSRNDTNARLLSSFSSEIDEFAKELSDKKKKMSLLEKFKKYKKSID